MSIDRQDERRWLVCESGQRWARAVRRFAPDLMPKPLVPSISTNGPQQTLDQLASRRGHQAVLLWESPPGSLLPVCDSIVQADRICPIALQLVAASDRTEQEYAILLEFPCAAILRHPEDLAGIRVMIEAYFRRER